MRLGRLGDWPRRRLLARVRRIMDRRAPDFVIGGPGDPYLQRWYLIPRNRWLNVYAHRFLRSDDDRALHDHPWASCSLVLDGGYIEEVPADPGDAAGPRDRLRRRPGAVTWRGARAAHRVELKLFYPRGNASLSVWASDAEEAAWLQARGWRPLPAITLFLTGPKVRTWGFHCGAETPAGGWRPWKAFVDQRDSGSIGRGCE